MQRKLDILLVEDNLSLSENIAEYLEALGHRLDFAHDGTAGLARALEAPFDVVILDLALPRRDGLEVCREIKARSTRAVPVLMLTARDTLDDKLTGFAHGADDYLTKPFALAELAARCQALALRQQLGTEHRIRIGTLTVDRRAMTAERCGQPIALTPLSFRILLHLAEAYPATVPRHDLAHAIWGEDMPDSDSLRSHIHLLRQAIDKPFGTASLETLHGFGFRLRDEA